jgi:DNA invertase Pin-like site-specific DNA recombinase
MTTAVLYARHSPRPGAECDSCQKQHDRQRAYCLAMGWEVILEDKDEGVSGDDPGREGFERALEAACRHKAVFVVYDITRFAREARLGLEMWDRLIKAKAHLAAVAEGINTLSPLGKHITKLIFTILSGVAEMQLAMIRERTSKAMRHYQAQGRRMGRLDRCPYGKMPDLNGPMVKDKETGRFTDRPAQMIDHPEEQAVLERITQLRAEGNGLRKIAKHLEGAGIPCRGKRWHASTIASILKRNVLSVS